MTDAGTDAQQMVKSLTLDRRLRLSDPFTELGRCPHCKAAKPTLNFYGLLYRTRNPYKGSNTAWATYQCTSCGDPISFLIEAPLMDDPRQQREFIKHQSPISMTMHPASAEDFSDWPDRAKRYMEQAVESLHAPDAAVMLTGSAVDAMLKEKGFSAGSVYARITAAVGDHLLTAEMGEWAHSVRLAANNPRHADLDSPHATSEEASASIDFAKALGQFMFVLPARVKRGQVAAVTASQKANQTDK